MIRCFGFLIIWTLEAEYILFLPTFLIFVSNIVIIIVVVIIIIVVIIIAVNIVIIIIASDLGRSLIKFGKGYPLGEKGLDWLKIHLATLHGAKSKSVPLS